MINLPCFLVSLLKCSIYLFPGKFARVIANITGNILIFTFFSQSFIILKLVSLLSSFCVTFVLIYAQFCKFINIILGSFWKIVLFLKPHFMPLHLRYSFHIVEHVMRKLNIFLVRDEINHINSTFNGIVGRQEKLIHD